MAVLLLFCLPLVFCAYAFQLEERNKHFFAFFTGITVTALFLLTVSSFFSKTDVYIGTLKSYLFYVFLTDTLIPVGIVIVIVLLLSRFNALTVPAALFGLFTVKIYQQLFLTSAHLRIMPIVFTMIVYTGALFILDAFLHFCSDATFHYGIVCILGFLLFMGVLLLGVFGLGLYYFGRNTVVYSSIFTGIAVIGTILHFAVHRGRTSG